MARLLRQTLVAVMRALEDGQRPEVSVEELPCFTVEALRGNPNVSPDDLEVVLDSLGLDDILTFETALAALAAGKPAWLGFKVVVDATLAVDSEDTEVVGITGKGEGSADALPAVFVVTADRQIVCSRPYSKRDGFQMLDIASGPHMHNEQYRGVAWLSIPLEHNGIVYIFGAGEIAHYLESMARDCDFETVVVDYDSAYLNEERLPLSRRVLVDSFTGLSDVSDLAITPADYVLVLTRGHMYDPEVITYGIEKTAHYVGMMGCLDKNERVFAMVAERGIPLESLKATHTPIGLKFGAKTPAELALCIVAELIQVRNEARKA